MINFQNKRHFIRCFQNKNLHQFSFPIKKITASYKQKNVISFLEIMKFCGICQLCLDQKAHLFFSKYKKSLQTCLTLRKEKLNSFHKVYSEKAFIKINNSFFHPFIVEVFHIHSLSKVLSLLINSGGFNLKITYFNKYLEKPKILLMSKMAVRLLFGKRYMRI